ncbi:MAG: hypothetical protein IKR23_05980 [Lachnospiraceae bacterium]|nr:hypothetical protein [Lachnospiraceae bacterium]
MAYCAKCGIQLPAGSNFCDNCGAPVVRRTPQGQAMQQAAGQPHVMMPQGQMMQQNRPVPYQQMNPSSQASTIRQQGMNDQLRMAQEQARQRAMQMGNNAAGQFGTQARQALRGMLQAPDAPGEIPVGDFGGILNIGNNIRSAAGAVRSGQKRGVRGWLAFLFAILITVFSILQITSKLDGVNDSVMKVLNYITFARGGIGRSPVGFIGGVFGKATIVSALCTLFGGGLGTVFTGIKSIFVSRKTEKAQGMKGSVFLFILGFLLSAALYWFCVGNIELSGTMVAISGIITALRSVGSRKGMLYGFASAFAHRKKDGRKYTDHAAVRSFMVGISFGLMAISALVAVLAAKEVTLGDIKEDLIYELDIEPDGDSPASKLLTALGVDIEEFISTDEQEEEYEEDEEEDRHRKDKEKEKEKDKDKDKDHDKDNAVDTETDAGEQEVFYDEVSQEILEEADPDALKENYIGKYYGKMSVEVFGMDALSQMTGMPESTVAALAEMDGKIYDVTAEFDGDKLVINSDELPDEVKQGLGLSFRVHDEPENGIYVDEEKGEEDGYTFHMIQEIVFMDKGRIYALNGVVVLEGEELFVGMSVRVGLKVQQ